MRVAVIGLGSIGRRHVHNLRRLGVQSVLTYDDPSGRDEAIDYHVWSRRPDAVIIATPPDSHLSLIEQAAQHGVKGIFCEKPLALHQPHEPWLAKLDDYVTHVACPLLWHDSLRALRQLPAVNLAMLNCFYDPRPCKPYMEYTGSLLDIGSHEVALARWLFGNLRLLDYDGEGERRHRLDLRAESGPLVRVAVGWRVGDYEREAVIVADGGAHSWRFDPAEHEEAYRREMAAFLDACRTGDASALNPISEASKTLALLLEAKAWAER